MAGQQTSAIAFEGTRRLAFGSLSAVARIVRESLDQRQDRSVLVLDAQHSGPIDLDLRGTPDEVERRYSSDRKQKSDIDEPVNQHHSAIETPDSASSGDAADPQAIGAARGRGRPRLGVIPREVTLLPRHWDWLATQPGGASVTLRRLVEHARTASVAKDRAREATDATYRFLMHLAGNEIGFEEATRALFAGERERFLMRIAQWPEDVREHAERLAEPAFV